MIIRNYSIKILRLSIYIYGNIANTGKKFSKIMKDLAYIFNKERDSYLPPKLPFFKRSGLCFLW